MRERPVVNGPFDLGKAMPKSGMQYACNALGHCLFYRQKHPENLREFNRLTTGFLDLALFFLAILTATFAASRANAEKSVGTNIFFIFLRVSGDWIWSQGKNPWASTVCVNTRILIRYKNIGGAFRRI